MSDDEDQDAHVLVFRGAGDRPVAVPSDIVEEAEKPFKAYQEYLRGRDWGEIAAELGFPSAKAVERAVDLYLREGAALVAQVAKTDMLNLEIARLNALQSAIWPAAMKGSVAAVTEARAIIKTRIEALRLDEIEDADLGGANRTVIVIPDSEYKERLQEIAGDAPAAE